jgi:hypothetical protein
MREIVSPLVLANGSVVVKPSRGTNPMLFSAIYQYAGTPRFVSGALLFFAHLDVRPALWFSPFGRIYFT